MKFSRGQKIWQQNVLLLVNSTTWQCLQILIMWHLWSHDSRTKSPPKMVSLTEKIRRSVLPSSTQKWTFSLWPRMLNRFKNVVANAVGGVSSVQEEKLEKIEGKVELAEKFPYSRPNFLQLTEDEVQVSADHTARPILLPRQFDRLPWHAGYAEYVIMIYKLHEFVFILCSFLLHQFYLPWPYHIHSISLSLM